MFNLIASNFSSSFLNSTTFLKFIRLRFCFRSVLAYALFVCSSNYSLCYWYIIKKVVSRHYEIKSKLFTEKSLTSKRAYISNSQQYISSSGVVGGLVILRNSKVTYVSNGIVKNTLKTSWPANITMEHKQVDCRCLNSKLQTSNIDFSNWKTVPDFFTLQIWVIYWISSVSKKQLLIKCKNS